MTGIVVVSHSRALAVAAIALAAEMVPPDVVRIEVAAGVDAAEGPTFGTDATAIMRALVAADDGDGVVVLMDLGSAVLSAELALELVDDSLRERVRLCPAPLVEGLVIAAVAAAGGAGPAEVCAEASDALAAKQAQLRLDDSESIDQSAGEAVSQRPVRTPAAVTASFEITNVHGLHARPAARLVGELGRFRSIVTLTNLTTGAGPASAASLSRVATLAALKGHRVEIVADGTDAQEAVDAALELAGRAFDDPADGSVPAYSHPVGSATAGPAAASPGIAIGPAVVLASAPVVVPDEPGRGVEAEQERSDAARATVRAEVAQTRDRAAEDVGAAEAAVFDAHLLLLDDPDLLTEVRARLATGASAARAWIDATEVLVAAFDALPDSYLRARAADVHAVGTQVARRLVGVGQEDANVDGVLVAEDLTPAQVATLDPRRVLGLILAGSSPTGHSAILAKARGIPAVVAAGAEVLQIVSGTTVALDGSTAEIAVDPDPETLERLRDRAIAERAAAAVAGRRARDRAVTLDGVEILVAANVGSVEDARAATASGADGAGLVRTEFLFLGRDDAPDIDEQIGVYLAIADALEGRRMTLRTLDVGGDKPLAYARQPLEANPFLGVRGLRLALADRTLLRDQLLAAVTVAHETPVSLMFPMVSTVEELVDVRGRLDTAIRQVGRGVPLGLEVGIMVEVPAAALKAAAFAPYVDFFSIGTNDLTQYTLAAERGNPALARLADPLDPGVVTLLHSVCQGAAGGALVAVCGELAADPRAAGLLVALGVRELSMAPVSVAAVKQVIRDRAVSDDAELVKRCLAAGSADDIRALLR